IRHIHEVTVEGAELRGSVADVTVRFVSDQVNMTLAADGKPVTGTDSVTELKDLWTFQRDLKSGDPTWRLVDTRSV
ncbi:TIM44-like domain-containing protein, partial [Roseomonas sp. DSM 102946]|nr:TIM44-like domain-containing protein [Roseomonas sp. DSM 102946]